MQDITETGAATGTEVGSDFVANYPPFSVWPPDFVYLAGGAPSA
jgi:hypothetical protein